MITAEKAFEKRGLRMPDMLRSMLRTLFTTAYQAGVEAQREVVILELEATPEGRAILARGDVARPRRLP